MALTREIPFEKLLSLRWLEIKSLNLASLLYHNLTVLFVNVYDRKGRSRLD